MSRDNPKAHAQIPTAPLKKPSGHGDELDGSAAAAAHHEEHEGATDAEVGDTVGPGAGYDDEPEQVKDKGGVS